MKEAIRYLAFGDSLTVGYGATPGQGFVPLYAKALEEGVGREVRLRNAGVNGATTQHLLDLLRTDPALREHVRESELITITAGGNDLIQAALPFVYEGDSGILQSALQAYENNYRGILEAIRDVKAGRSGNSLIVLVGLYNPLPLMAEAGEWVRRFNEYLRKPAGPDVHVVDVYDAFAGREREFLYSDHIHPNEQGYAEIAEQIVRSVPNRIYEMMV
jgi:lysophospholipase L1-like esterase